MRRDRLDEFEDEREALPEELSLADIVENAARKLVTAIVIAGGLIALAIYFRSSPSSPRYQAAVGDGRIVRVDTRNGTVLACEGTRCFQVLRRGQRLVDAPAAKALPAPAAPAAREAQPAPAPPPSNAAVPAR
ncbi:MAG TPA: hypothetical protein VMS43_06625 [Allosphingosinicella sp.]|nr:hypothetical protein [Allosphingosinicella sp.]